MGLTKYGLEFSGFKEYPENDILNVKFRMVDIFIINGLSLEGEETTSQIVTYDGNCRAMIGNNLEQIFKDLLDTRVDDNYFNKLSEHRLFLVIDYFSEKIYSSKGGYRKENENTIDTYFQFESAKKDIAKIKEKNSHSIIVAIHTQLSKIFNEINIVFKDCIFFGKSTSEKTVIDSQINASVNISSSMRQDNFEEINSLLNLSKDKKYEIENLGVVNYYNGHQEKDPYKKFIYYYTFIETYTHKSFKKNKNIEVDMGEYKNDIGEYKNELLDYPYIRERFIFCSLHIWENMKKEDIDDFLELKEIRNSLAHGRNPKITVNLITKIEKLSLKVIS